MLLGHVDPHAVIEVGLDERHQAIKPRVCSFRRPVPDQFIPIHMSLQFLETKITSIITQASSSIKYLLKELD